MSYVIFPFIDKVAFVCHSSLSTALLEQFLSSLLRSKFENDYPTASPVIVTVAGPISGAKQAPHTPRSLSKRVHISPWGPAATI